MLEQLLKGHSQPAGPSSRTPWLTGAAGSENSGETCPEVGRSLAVLGWQVGGGRKEGQLLKVKRGKSSEGVGGAGREMGWKLERSQRFGPGAGEIMEKSLGAACCP